MTDHLPTSNGENMAKQEELKYVEKLDISTLSINRIKEIIKRNIKNTIYCWKKNIPIEKQTFHIIGPAGVGKTQICYQIAEELTTELNVYFDTIMIKCPVLSRDDFLIPFPIIDKEKGTKKFEMLYSDFVPTNAASFGLFVIDEFSRGDHALQQLMWQIQNEGKLHRYDFPKGWFCISIDNPDDREYSMDTMEDAAGLRRMLHIYTEVNVKDFLDYAIEHKFHPGVIEFIQAHPERIYDFDAQKTGSVFANPASWERVSNILQGYEMSSGGILNDITDIDVLVSGLLNTNMTRLFIEFIRENKGVNPKDIINKYDSVRHKILKMNEEEDNAALGEAMTGFTTYLTTSMPEIDDKKMKNFVRFILDMPVDIAALFVTQLNQLDRRSKAYMYVVNLHTKAIKTSAPYREDFYEKMSKTSKS